MELIFTPLGSIALSLAVWLFSAWLITQIADVNLVQRINFGTINAIFVLLFVHLVLK